MLKMKSERRYYMVNIINNDTKFYHTFSHISHRKVCETYFNSKTILITLYLSVLENWAKCDEIKEECPDMEENFEKISEILDNEDVRNKLKTDILYLLYNLRDIVIETRKEKEKERKKRI